MAQIVSNVPVLPSRDLKRSAEFYAKLGYKAAHSFSDYLILFRDGVELHLAQMDVEPAQNPAGLYLRVAGVDELAHAFDLRAEISPGASASSPWPTLTTISCAWESLSQLDPLPMILAPPAVRQV